MPLSELSDLALIRSDQFLTHAVEGGHPENPRRLQCIHQALDRHPVLSKLRSETLTSAEKEELGNVHSSEMIAALHQLKGRKGWVDADTYYHPSSIEVALLAAGSTMALARKIWGGEKRRGFSLVRPPGHHATPRTPMGFCLYNNVALAAAAILAQTPSARLAVVDFDLHHGNGTQDFFYDNPNVLFISSHRFPYYPGTGALSEVGNARGRGTTINFPVGDESMADDFFIHLYQDLVSKMLKAFSPDMILVSAGYDGHREDPMTGFRISDEGYRRLSELLIQAAEQNSGKILFCLEGGYNAEALGRSVIQTLEAMVQVPRARDPEATLAPGLDTNSRALLEHFTTFHRQFFPELT